MYIKLFVVFVAQCSSSCCWRRSC